jgi:polyhydroxybutyrate depolymerase
MPAICCNLSLKKRVWRVMIPRLFLLLALLSFFGIFSNRAEGARAEHFPPDVVTDFNKFLVPGEYVGGARYDDRNREFIIVTPPGMKNDEPLPIVFFFHGAGGSAKQAARTYGWVDKARAKKFIVVFPEGLGVRADQPGSFVLNMRVWRDERSDIPGLVDDVHFFEQLLTEFESCLPVDPRRVFVTGFSNGAGMAFTLGAHFSDRIAAIAPVSSQSFVQIDKLARPLPVYYLVGTADPLIPYAGGTVTLPWGAIRTWPPVQASVDTWAKLDGCPPRPETVSDEAGVRVLRYGPGEAHSEVLFTVVEGNGHHWPGTIEPLPRAICGPTLDPFSATDRIWKFFERHPLRSP